jgi:ABC-2 type transport system permease protein
MVMLIGIPITAAVVSFRYLQSKALSDQFYSLPVRRSALFNASFCSGFTLFATPILINAVTLMLLRSVLHLNSFVLKDVIVWAGFSLLMASVVYSLSVFSAMIIGSSGLQILFTLILMGLPSGVMLLLNYVCQKLVFGYSIAGRAARYYTPFYRIFDGAEDLSHHFVDYEILPYLIVFFGFYMLSCFLSTRRLSENAGQSVVIKSLEPFLKYLASFCSALLGSLVINLIFEGTWSIFIGYFLGGLLGFFLAEKLIHMHSSIQLKEVSIAAALLLIGALTLVFDLTGFERWSPRVDQISEIMMSVGDNGMVTFKEQENISRIIALHKEILHQKGNLELQNGEWSRFVFTTIEGQHHLRAYSVSETHYENMLKPIYESSEARRLFYPVLSLVNQEVSVLRIQAGHSPKSISITEPYLIEEALNAIQLDCRTKEWKPGEASMRSLATLSFEYKTLNAMNNDVEAEIGIGVHNSAQRLKHNDANFMEFLKRKGLLDQVRPSANEVNRILIKKIDTPQEVMDFRYGYRTIELADAEVIEITNPVEIQACLDTPSYSMASAEPFYAFTIYYLEDITWDSGVFQKQIPAFLNN